MEEKDLSASLLPVDPSAAVNTETLPHSDSCASHICRWCESHDSAHATFRPDCEFSPRLCDCVVDHRQAREMTPPGFTVTEWMQEMVEQHTTMKAVLRELLAELKRCHEAGESFDFLADVVTRAYDTVGVIRVTPADLDLLGSGTDSQQRSER